MESTRKTVKNSGFFFFFTVRSTVVVNDGSQRSKAAVNADVALTH
jgi:hypothetical protein